MTHNWRLQCWGCPARRTCSRVRVACAPPPPLPTVPPNTTILSCLPPNCPEWSDHKGPVGAGWRPLVQAAWWRYMQPLGVAIYLCIPPFFSGPAGVANGRWWFGTPSCLSPVGVAFDHNNCTWSGVLRPLTLCVQRRRVLNWAESLEIISFIHPQPSAGGGERFQIIGKFKLNLYLVKTTLILVNVW